MMGRQDRDQGQLFYEFNLDDVIARDHLLRRMNGFVAAALDDLHPQLRPFYSDIGRPSVDPELLIRMLIVGYCYGIRHERRLCEEVKLHLGYRWFCKLDLTDKVPHHSTFSINRLDFRFDRGRNVYICPAGKLLRTSGRVHSDHAIRYLASVPCCRECPLKPRCCPNMPSRRIARDVNEAARDIARRNMKTKAFLKSRDERKRVEMRFAHLK